MKRLIFGFVALNALSALAMPANTSDLIQALLSSSSFKEALARYGEETRFSGIRIDRIKMEGFVRRLCGTNSRSASALEVTFEMADHQVVYTYATDGSPTELHFCL